MQTATAAIIKTSAVGVKARVNGRWISNSFIGFGHYDSRDTLVAILEIAEIAEMGAILAILSSNTYTYPVPHHRTVCSIHSVTCRHRHRRRQLVKSQSLATIQSDSYEGFLDRWRQARGQFVILYYTYSADDEPNHLDSGRRGQLPVSPSCTLPATSQIQACLIER